MRRWEDWERSRLRKIKRDERRRKDFERTHPGAFMGAGNPDFLIAPDTRSMYDGSDTVSVTSSDDDHWGGQIGGYNENGAAFPPPPVGLFVPEQTKAGPTVGGADLEAMLEMGFDDKPTPPNSTYAPRYQLNDAPTAQMGVGAAYSPLTRTSSPAASPRLGPSGNPLSPLSPSVDLPPRGHRLQSPPPGPRNYGPLGPLDPSSG